MDIACLAVGVTPVGDAQGEAHGQHPWPTGFPEEVICGEFPEEVGDHGLVES